MNLTRIPPLNSLRAFAALADSKSYTRAAAKLNVTHPAVRQQVKTLEEHLGVALVFRQGRGISLTPDGQALARDLENAFGVIHQSISRLTGSEAARPVQITTSPAFAVEWLMPQIAEFQQTHPDITLLLNPTADLIELRPGGVDVAIRYRDHRKVDDDVETVLVSDMVVVGASSLVEENYVAAPSTLVDLPWLQELGTNEVAEWFERRGVTTHKPLIVSQMPGNLIMQAVRRGDGITYTARAFFRDEIRSGQVRVLHSEAAAGHYCLKVSSGPVRPSLKTFLTWLRSKAEIVVA